MPACEAMATAEAEARRLGSNMIGTEHILLGLCQHGMAPQVLTILGVPVRQIVAAILSTVGSSPTLDESVEIALTPRAKKVIEYAVDESRRMNHMYIGTEHLLIGLQREGEGIAAVLLESRGITLERIRETVVSLLKGRSDDEITALMAQLDVRVSALEKLVYKKTRQTKPTTKRKPKNSTGSSK